MKGADDKYTVTQLTPYNVYQGSDIKNDTNLKGGCVFVNGTGYTEGVYDLSEYLNKEIVVVIELVAPDTDTAILKCHFNEVAFRSNGDTEFGKPAISAGVQE